MAGLAKALGQIVLPRVKGNPAGTALTSTFKPSGNTQALSGPTYREHLTDLVSSRQSLNSKQLLQQLFQQDPDVSAALAAYLTLADTPFIFTVHDQNGKIDRKGWQTVSTLVTNLGDRTDYSQGFQFRPTLNTLCEEFRYMVLLRGGIGGEAVLDKFLSLSEIRNVDLADVTWYEKSAGQYKPKQKTANSSDEIDLDIPTFFVSFFRRDPTSIYSQSTFISAINTIAARQLVINELFRIMQVTGYPRIHVEVLEEVLLKNAPADVLLTKEAQINYVNSILSTVSNTFGSLRSDQPFATTDSVKVNMVNDRNPGAAMDISHVINVLNSQNQAALKVVATVIGRGESGVNTASVEARIFSMNADDLNDPVAELLSNIFTLALRLQGSTSRVEFKFLPSELRPSTELEPQLTLRQDRLLTALSYGVISDEEFHLWMFNRLPPEGAQPLAGTGFYTQKTNAADVSSNADPLGRSLTPQGSGAAKSKSVGKPK